MKKTLDIVGGAYRESVMRPMHYELLGSAGRAAAALGPQRARITLHTAIRNVDLGELEQQAKTYGFALRTTNATQTMSFKYAHGLDAPIIFPSPHVVQKSQLSVACERVLCYGALDIDWRINGGQVVYDPQDAFAPKSFKATNSRAQRLAIVLNQSEARLLTGERDAKSQITALFEIDSPEVVVLKCGANGTMIAVKRKKPQLIPPLITPSMFKVGSGDVFSAMFSWAWACEGQPAVDSAKIASAATANYVAMRSLPIPAGYESDNAVYEIRPTKLPPKDASVYLAGPFFSLADLWLVEECRAQLADGGLKVFSPYHDIGLGRAEEVAPQDTDAIRKCDIVYAIVTNLDPGTLFEIGYARSLGKPVVAFVENERTEDLKMLKGTGCILEADFATSIYRAVWEARFRP